MRYDQYYSAIHRYSPSGRFCENGISLTFILRRSVPRQLHAGTVWVWRWNSNHSDLGKKKLTTIFWIFSTDISSLMIYIRVKCISEFTDEFEFKNLCAVYSRRIGSMAKDTNLEQFAYSTLGSRRTCAIYHSLSSPAGNPLRMDWRMV